MASAAATVALLVVTVCAAGCGSRTEGAKPAGSHAEPHGLLAALGMVRATEGTRGYLRYGDIGRTRELVAADEMRWWGMHGHGLGRLRNYLPQIKDGLRVDPLAMRQSIQTGLPDQVSTILWGDYDVDAVDERLADRKIRRTDLDGATEWTTNAVGRWDPHGPLSRIVPTNDFNNIRTQPGLFAFSPYRDVLAWVTDPGQDTLAQDATARTLAECLGDDVVAATIARKGFDAPLAVGVRVPDTAHVIEVICVAPGSTDQAAKIRDQVEELLAHGESPLFRAPWSQRVPNATVEVTHDDIVRVVSRRGPRDGAGGVLQMVETTEIKDLVETS